MNTISNSALVKPTQERWLKLQDLILRLKSRHVLTARCLMSLIGLLASMEKMVPEGRLHMRPFQFHLKEHWRYPQSLDSLLPWTEAIAAHLDWWQNPSNVMRGADLHPKVHSIQLFTDASNEGWGAHLDQSSTKGLWSDREKKPTHKRSRIEGGLPGPSKLQGLVPEPNSASRNGQLNSGSLHKQTRRNSLSRDVCSPVEDHDLVPSLSYNIESQTHSRVSECDGRPSVQVEPVQSTEWSLHPQVFKQICQKWFTPHVDLFATHLNHKLPLYVSPVPDPNAWDIDALNINWTGLTAYAYPPTALIHRVIQKIRQCYCLIIVKAPGWPGMPWFWDLVQLSTEIPLQLTVSTTLLKQSHNYVFHSNPQHLNLHAWCLGVDSSKNKASLWRWQRELLPLRGHQQEPSINQSGPYLKNGAGTIYKSKWALFEKWCRENSVDFSTPSVKQVSDFFMYLYQDLNRRPSTIDGYRTAIGDTLGPAGHHIAQSSDLHRLLSSFHRDRPKSSRNLPKWNLSVVLNELTKAPFEPMKDTDLKHVTLKTPFLLALASSTSLLLSKHLDSFSTVIHSIQVFGSLQARSSGLGHCKRDSDWYF